MFFPSIVAVPNWAHLHLKKEKTRKNLTKPPATQPATQEEDSFGVQKAGWFWIVKHNEDSELGLSEAYTC